MLASSGQFALDQTLSTTVATSVNGGAAVNQRTETSYAWYDGAVENSVRLIVTAYATQWRIRRR